MTTRRSLPLVHIHRLVVHGTDIDGREVEIDLGALDIVQPEDFYVQSYNPVKDGGVPDQDVFLVGRLRGIPGSRPRATYQIKRHLPEPMMKDGVQEALIPKKTPRLPRGSVGSGRRKTSG